MTQPELDAAVAEWNAVKAWLSTAKLREIELRRIIASEMFGNLKMPNGCFPEGTTHQIYGGYRGKLVAKLNRDILEELLIPTLAQAQLTPDEAKGLIRGKPELGLTAYKALPPAKRAIIDNMLVVKPGAIELEVEPT